MHRSMSPWFQTEILCGNTKLHGWNTSNYNNIASQNTDWYPGTTRYWYFFVTSGFLNWSLEPVGRKIAIHGGVFSKAAAKAAADTAAQREAPIGTIGCIFGWIAGWFLVYHNTYQKLIVFWLCDYRVNMCEHFQSLFWPFFSPYPQSSRKPARWRRRKLLQRRQRRPRARLGSHGLCRTPVNKWILTGCIMINYD